MEAKREQDEMDELIRLQLELQCFDVTRNGLLVHIRDPSPVDLDRTYITGQAGGFSLFLRHGLPLSLRERLKVLTLEQGLNDSENIERNLTGYISRQQIRCWRTSIFPNSLTSADYPNAVRLGEVHRWPADQCEAKMRIAERTAFAVIVEGQIVSTCKSTAENARAAEAWVSTLPAYRRRGYARQVTAAWGHSLQQQGKVGFYTYQWENVAAHSLARSLGLIHIFDILEGQRDESL